MDSVSGSGHRWLMTRSVAFVLGVFGGFTGFNLISDYLLFYLKIIIHTLHLPKVIFTNYLKFIFCFLTALLLFSLIFFMSYSIFLKRSGMIFYHS